MTDDGSLLDAATRKPMADAPAAKLVEAADKLALQGYGRPYGSDGKPGGRFYSFPRTDAPLPTLS